MTEPTNIRDERLARLAFCIKMRTDFFGYKNRFKHEPSLQEAFQMLIDEMDTNIDTFSTPIKGEAELFWKLLMLKRSIGVTLPNKK